jgi:uracil-DNA glycosylase
LLLANGAGIPKRREAAQLPLGTSYKPSSMNTKLPSSWQAVVGDELKKPYFKELAHFVDAERKHHEIYPPDGEVFNAFRLTPCNKVKVCLLGQDPYPGKGQAHGLAFSVRPGVRIPASLVNIFKELHNDLGCKVPNNGCLVPWAERGVMLLNTVLTVRAGEPNSHKGKGWEKFTDSVIRALGEREQPVVFLLWGAHAQKKVKLIDTERDPVLTSGHPSPLSMKKFFGSQPFSRTNAALEELGEEPIDWQIPDLPTNPKR